MWEVFVKAIFSGLNLKLDYGFLPYNMHEVFNKTEHGLTAGQVLKISEMNLRQSCTQSFLGK